tara:strand:+ start:85 stop:573 length:489 start_codon:yes stop_codon:yes gene_type:complete
MQYKNNTKQRSRTIQGLRSFSDTLPKNIKQIIKKKGHIYSETLNNWKYIVGDEIFKFSYPRSFKLSNKFGVNCLIIMVERGHEIDLEYSKKKIIDKMNSYFGYKVVEKIKLVRFDENQTNINKSKSKSLSVTNSKRANKIFDIKNDKIKNSLLKLNKLFKKK